MNHRPVLLHEALDLLVTKPGGTYIDGTAGGGGHAEELLSRSGPGTRLWLIDRDPEALERARLRLRKWESCCRFIWGNFADMKQMADEQRWEAVDGVLLDIGVSSHQLDEARRGFGFMHDGPLDMRMNPADPVTAADLVNRLSAAELAHLFRRYGEEPQARRIAEAIVAARAAGPIRTTGELAAVISGAYRGKRGRLHPATRVFQALRIEVNRELESLERGLDGALAVLQPGGRLAVISFHSLEDRIVKHFGVEHAGRWQALPQGGSAWCGTMPKVRIVTKKPVVPTVEEQEANPRSRSAKLRVMEKEG